MLYRRSTPEHEVINAGGTALMTSLYHLQPHLDADVQHLNEVIISIKVDIYAKRQWLTVQTYTIETVFHIHNQPDRSSKQVSM